MHDEFRVQVQTKSTGALIAALKDLESAKSAGPSPRLAVTHEGEHVFLYADSSQAAEHAREVAEQALQERGIVGQVTSSRWHPLEERWEDASESLPATEAERETEHARLEQLETDESQQLGEPEWEVYVSLPTHHDARAFAERLRGEGIPVNQRWRHLLVGANDEDDAAAMAKRLQVEAPPGSEIHAQGNGLEYWRMLHPYAYLGGLAN
ncbi:MAG: hypothetical protein WAN93_14120 [Solirubrobacteraceae bacterium]